MTADTQAQGDLVKLAQKCGAVVYRRGETWVMLNFNNPELEAFAAALQGRTQEGEPSDEERLDWLEQSQSSLYTCTHEAIRPSTATPRSYERYCVFDGFAVGMHGEAKPTVREAIDAAMPARAALAQAQKERT